MHYALKYPPRLEVNLYTHTHTILLSQSHSQLLGCHSWTDTSRENIWQPPSSELFLHKTPHTFVLTMIKFSVTEEVKLSFHSKLASNGLHYLKCLLCPDCSLTSLALPVCCWELRWLLPAPSPSSLSHTHRHTASMYLTSTSMLTSPVALNTLYWVIWLLICPLPPLESIRPLWGLPRTDPHPTTHVLCLPLVHRKI